MTPKRAEATCLIALRRQSPLASRTKRPGILAAFAGVALAADAVHRDREVLVRLLADRSERHRAGFEALDDLARRARPLRAAPASDRLELEQAAQRREARRVLIDRARYIA